MLSRPRELLRRPPPLLLELLILRIGHGPRMPGIGPLERLVRPPIQFLRPCLLPLLVLLRAPSRLGLR